MNGADPLMSDATELVAALAAREISCAELMRATLARVDALNPSFNAIVARREPEALMAEARAKDAELAAGARAGPLFGLPMAIKELENVAGLLTTKGSPLLSGNIAAADSEMVRRLKAAGAIVIGKTTSPEFALGSYSRSPVYGITRNAYDERLTAGGSSSGAAVALALRMLPLADGSDYGGSLRNPAGWNNVYGFRPSFGRIPREDLDAWTPSLGVLGPMARTADDLALLFSVQVGYHALAPLSLETYGGLYRPPLEGDLPPTRIAWVGDFGGAIPFDPGVLELARSAMATFESLGAKVEEATPDFDMQELWRAFKIIRHWHNAPLLSVYRDPVLRAQLPETAIYEVEEGLKLSAYDVSAALQTRARWSHALARFQERYDFWALPTAQCFAFAAEAKGADVIGGRRMTSYHEWMQCVVPGTMSGAPVLAAPAGFDAQGRAMGVQIASRPRDELGLLRLARAYDRATEWPKRKLPEALRDLSPTPAMNEPTK